MARILLVDDSQFSRLSIRQLIAGSGHEIVEAGSGGEALDLVRSATPDCVILDLLMPGMGGFDVLGRLRDMGSTVPVVVLTADIQKTTEQRCLELGASAVVHKPCTQERLDATLAHALGERRP